ncbi:MAG: PAS domain-containing protein [Candidatus Sericytochromatia bacterium]
MADPGPELLLAALETLSEAVLLAEADGSLIYVNASAYRLLGLTAEDRQWPAGSLRLIDGTPVLPEADPLAIAASGGRLEAAQFLIGTQLVRCWAGSLSGPQPGLLVKFQELNEPEAGQAELLHTTRFLDGIVENIPDMIFVKEAKELRFERFNRAGEELLGIARNELLGRNDYDLFPTEQADFFQARDRQTLAGKSVVDIPEEPIDTKHGVRWLHTKKIPILDEQGEPLYLLGISQDITARKNAEELLRRTNEELEQRVAETVATLRSTEAQLLQAQKMEALGRLAGGVAHDFNNMLTVIHSYAELLADSRCEPDEAAEQIMHAAERATRLTRQLLAFSRRQVLQPKLLEANLVVKEVSAMIRHLIREDIELVSSLQAEGRVFADQGQLEQVSLNLAVNARDAMPEGGRLSIVTRNDQIQTSSGHLEAGDYLVIGISDSGMGIATEVLPRIFEPFFTTKEQGTGLGLATVHGIVHQSGGEVLVSSETGVGTRFEIWLPRIEAGADPTLSRLPAGPLPAGCATVLVVEDEPLVREAVIMALVAGGYRVLSAADGEEALQLISSHSEGIDLLLTDVVMPGMSGPRLAEQVRQLMPQLRIVLMSGYTGDVTTKHGVEASGLPFVQKPFSGEQLLAAIRTALEPDDFLAAE